MFDSASKLPHGILEGNVVNYGSFDECLAITNKNKRIQGKYCQIKLYSKHNQILKILDNDDKDIRAGIMKLTVKYLKECVS